MDIECLSFDWQSTQTFSSSIIKELHINVKCINDCLHILNLTSNQLEKLFVTIQVIDFYWSTINREEKYLKLKCFSLTSIRRTGRYDDIIIPLLHRMLNLDSLTLYLLVYDHYRKKKLLDGNDLKRDLLDHLPRLNQLSFHICSEVVHPIDVPSNEDIQRTLTHFQNDRILSFVDYFQEKDLSQCHIYTLPCTMKFYQNITNHFPGGLFEHVHEICLFDERPFEHEFFLQISHSFPFLRRLALINHKPQKHNKSQRLIDQINVIRYPYLIEVNPRSVHEDYVEQFLDQTKTSLPNNIRFPVAYEHIEKVTHQFTRETTRINCSKITSLYPSHLFQLTEKFQRYFPLVDPQSMFCK